MKSQKLFLTLIIFLSSCASPAIPAQPTSTVAPTMTATPTIQVTPTPRIKPSPSPTSSLAAIHTPAWFRDVVMYEIFVRSFYDSNGDGIGDLKGITLKLDYIQSLGARALWLTPIFASPSYHGYDISDYYKINPEFGTEADFVELINEAHKRGIKVLLDYVVGHTSSQHPFFKDAYNNPSSKYSDWYRWNDAAHTRYDSFAGVKELPSLNHANLDAQKYLIDVAKYWMKLGVDGYRADYVLGVPHAFWKKLRAEVKAINPNFILLAEAWTDGTKIRDYFQNEFDAAFDFPFYGDVQRSQDKVGDSLLLGNASMSLLDGSIIAQPRLYPPDALRVTFINNHDTHRAMSEVDGDFARAKIGATLLLTTPGTPMIYYGEEIGMKGEKASAPDYDKTRREPMDWYANESGQGMTTWYKPTTRYNKASDQISVEEQIGKNDSLLEHYRALVLLRNSNSALRSGSFERVTVDDSKIYVYLRADDKAAFLIVLNLADTASSLTLDLGKTSLPDGTYSAVDALSKKPFDLNGLILNLNAEAKVSYVLQLIKK